jgi:hypothetical protein
MAKQIEKKHEFDKVSVFQSTKVARLVIEIKGDPEKTTPKLKDIHKILTEISQAAA